MVLGSSLGVCSFCRDININSREAREKNVEVIYCLPPGPFALTGVPHAFTRRVQQDRPGSERIVSLVSRVAASFSRVAAK